MSTEGQSATPAEEQSAAPAEVQGITPAEVQKSTPGNLVAMNRDEIDLNRDEVALNRNKVAMTRDEVALALYASNGLGNQQAQNPVLMSDYLANSFNALNEYAHSTRRGVPQAIMLANYSEQANHKMPFSVGLTISKHIGDRWAVQSGILYTRAESEFINRMNKAVVTTQQRLHYLGIPLQLRYDFWRLSRFTTYAAAGAQADYNISAERRTEGVDVQMHRDRLQWSFSAALGVQYNPVPAVGVFGEAALRYYPDNGSSVQNYFKDKPLGPSLQAGLRFNISH